MLLGSQPNDLQGGLGFSTQRLGYDRRDKDMSRERSGKHTSLKRKAKPMTRGLGGRKFFLPLIMKDPTTRYSPVGAVLDTCTHNGLGAMTLNL